MTKYQKKELKRLFNQFKEGFSLVLSEQEIYDHIKSHVVRMNYKKH